jgi:hypothetical protein
MLSVCYNEFGITPKVVNFAHGTATTVRTVSTLNSRNCLMN